MCLQDPGNVPDGLLDLATQQCALSTAAEEPHRLCEGNPLNKCSHGVPDKIKLGRGQSPEVVPNVDKQATSEALQCAFMEENLMNKYSHGDFEDTSCAYDQTELRRGKSF